MSFSQTMLIFCPEIHRVELVLITSFQVTITIPLQKMPYHVMLCPHLLWPVPVYPTHPKDRQHSMPQTRINRHSHGKFLGSTMWTEGYEAEDGPEFMQIYPNANASARKAVREHEHYYSCDNAPWWYIHCLDMGRTHSNSDDYIHNNNV